METDRLIQDLARDLKPVRPVWAAPFVTLAICILALATAAVGLAIYPMRGDVSAKFSEPFFVLALGLAASILVGCAFLFSVYSVPGRRPHGRLALAIWIALAFAVGVECWRVIYGGWENAMAGTNPNGRFCAWVVLLIAAVPTLALSIWAKSRAVTKPYLLGGLIPFAGLAAGFIAISLHCSIDNVMHIALWHLALPLACAALVGVLVLPKFLRW